MTVADSLLALETAELPAGAARWPVLPYQTVLGLVRPIAVEMEGREHGLADRQILVWYAPPAAEDEPAPPAPGRAPAGDEDEDAAPDRRAPAVTLRVRRGDPLVEFGMRADVRTFTNRHQDDRWYFVEFRIQVSTETTPRRLRCRTGSSASQATAVLAKTVHKSEEVRRALMLVDGAHADASIARGDRDSALRSAREERESADGWHAEVLNLREKLSAVNCELRAANSALAAAAANARPTLSEESLELLLGKGSELVKVWATSPDMKALGASAVSVVMTFVKSLDGDPEVQELLLARHRPALLGLVGYVHQFLDQYKIEGKELCAVDQWRPPASRERLLEAYRAAVSPADLAKVARALGGYLAPRALAAAYEAAGWRVEPHPAGGWRLGAPARASRASGKSGAAAAEVGVREVRRA